MVLCLKTRESRSLPGLQNAKHDILQNDLPGNDRKTNGPPSKRPIVVLNSNNKKSLNSIATGNAVETKAK